MNFENYKMFYWIKVGPLIQYVFQLIQSNVNWSFSCINRYQL